MAGADGRGVADTDRVLRAFLIADIRGYSTFVELRGIEAASALAARFVTIASKIVVQRGGEVADVRGDQVFSVFPSPRAALLAAADLQRTLVVATRDEPSLPLPVGVGLDFGEALEQDGEWSATAANVAARLCEVAAGGEILATEVLTDVVHSIDGIRFVRRGPTQLKGLDRRVRIVRVLAGDLDAVAELRRLGLARAAMHPGRRRRRAVLVGAAVVVAAAGVLASLAGRGSTPEPAAPARLAANSVGLLDAGSGARLADVRLGDRPGAVASGAGAVWVVTPSTDTVTRLSATRPNAPAVSVRVGDQPVAVAVGAGAAWIANAADRTVSRVDGTGLPPTVADTVAVGNDPSAIAVGYGRVWVANGIDGTVSVIDPRASPSPDRVVATIAVGAQPSAVLAADGGVWVTLADSARLVRIDPSTMKVNASVGVGNGPAALTADVRGVWVANRIDATVSRVDPRTVTVSQTVPVGRAPVAISAAGGAVWVADRDSDDVREIGTDGVRRTIRVARSPAGLVVDRAGVWVTAGEPASEHRGGTLRIAAAGDLQTLDPARAYSQVEWNVESVIHDGLVTFQRTGGPAGGTVVPDLAAALPQVSADGLAYTFQLRPGIRYSDGTPLRARDVRASFERLLRSPSAPPYYTAIEGAAACSPTRATCDLSRGVRTDDAAGTVVLRLSRPDPDLLDRLAVPFADILPAGTPETNLRFAPVPATGPYVISSATSTTVTLRRNPGFVAWSDAAQPPGYPDRIVLTYGHARQDRTVAAEARSTAAGRYDWSPDPLRPPLLDELITTRTSQVRAFPDGSVHYFFLNTHEAPFTDVRVRRAVNLAVDRRAAVQAFGGAATARVTCQIVAPSLPGYRPDCPYTAHPDEGGTWTAPDRHRARALIRRAHASGAVVRVLSTPGNAAVSRVEVEAMRAIGLDASLDVRHISGAAYYDYIATVANHVQSALDGWVVDYPSPSNLFGPLLSCDSRTATHNLDESLFCDHRIDRDMHAALALQTTDPTAAGMRWAAVDREVTAQAPWVPLTNGIVYTVVSSRLGNFLANPEFGMLIDQAWVR